MKKGLLSVMVGGLFLLISSIASASWHICTPAAIGSSADLNRIKVTGCDTDPTGALEWLSLDPTSADRQMATVLTAISLGKQVSIEVDGEKDAQNYAIAKYVIMYNE